MSVSVRLTIQERKNRVGNEHVSAKKRNLKKDHDRDRRLDGGKTKQNTTKQQPRLTTIGID